MDVYSVTRPARLAEGSARPLTAFVNWCNDALAGPDGYLSHQDGVLALELARQTLGTASVPATVIHAWVAELLVNPVWGVARYAGNAAAEIISDVADLHRLAASGLMPPTVAWDAVNRIARAAAQAKNPRFNEPELYALRAAYQSTAPLETDHEAALDAVTGNALRAHALATGATSPYRTAKIARNAIRTWRSLAAPDNTADVNPVLVENLERRLCAA